MPNLILKILAKYIDKIFIKLPNLIIGLNDTKFKNSIKLLLIAKAYHKVILKAILILKTPGKISKKILRSHNP